MQLNDTAGVFGQHSRASDWSANATPWQSAALCLAGALLSCVFTGFVFGISNNQFHLPIMEHLYDEPQFAQDAFVQSLKYFSSGIWLFLRALPKMADGGYTLFLLLFFGSRLLSFVGLVCCASLLGINTLRERLIFIAVVGATTLLDGNSVAGHGGLFVTFFSHSEIANGTILLAIFFAVKARFDAALIFAGATFFINAFMGIWVLAPLMFIAIAILRNEETSRRSLLSQTIVGAIGFAAFAAPILYNALSNPELRAPVDFDYTAFLREWYGAHYLIDANSAQDIFLLLALIWLGWLSFKTFGDRAPRFRAALLGALAVYLVGVIAPLIWPNPIMFKLHLLRSSAVIQMLAALGAAALATKWLCSPDRKQAGLFGPLLLFCLCASKAVIPLAGVVVVLASRWQPKGTYAALKPAILAALMVIVPWQFWQNTTLNRELTAAVADWQAVGSWAKSNTAPESMFMILTTSAHSLEQMPEADAQRALKLSTAAAAFEAAAHRRVWVDFFNGGMAVFQPSYYGEWHLRVTAVLSRRTLAEKLEYAQRNGIGYVVDDCSLFEQGHVRPIYRGGLLCAAAASPS